MAWTRSRFSIDGLDTYEGFHRGESWNGWACPAFERGEAERIAADYRAQGDRLPGPFSATYDSDTDAFLFQEPDDDPADGPISFGSGTIDADGVARTVYFIGTNYWTWELVEQPHDNIT